MPHVDRFENMDKAALHSALLAMRTCPNDRTNLRSVAFCREVWGCPTCRETWFLPEEEPDDV